MVSPLGVGFLSGTSTNQAEIDRLNAVINDLRAKLVELSNPSQSFVSAVPIEELLPDVEETMVDLLQPSLKQDFRSIVYAKVLDRLFDAGIPNLSVYDFSRAIESALPYLAHQFSVLGYRGYKYVEGNPDQQRTLLQNAIPLQRLTGSLDGFKKAAEIAGGELLAWIAPPNLAYPGRDWTNAERNAYLDLMPSLQTFRFDRYGSPGNSMFVGRSFATDADTLSSKKYFPQLQDDVYRRYFEQIYYVQPNGSRSRVNTYSLDISDLTGVGTVVQRVQLPGKALGVYPAADIAGAPRIPGTRAQKYFCFDSDARDRLYTIKFDQPYKFIQSEVVKQTISPGLDQIDVQYDLKRVKAPQRCLCAGAIFPGSRRLVSGFALPTTAPQRIYKEVHLHDPSLRFTAAYRGHVFANVTRLGMPPFRAELQVKRQYNRPAYWQSRYVAGFVRPPDYEFFDDVIRTTNEYKLARSKILVTTRTQQPVAAGNNRYSGDHYAGEVELYRRF